MTLESEIRYIDEMNKINQIAAIRTKNNELWMDILRIAFQYAPEQTKERLRQITINDKEISKLTEELSREGD